jgi:hypothetical protein
VGKKMNLKNRIDSINWFNILDNDTISKFMKNSIEELKRKSNSNTLKNAYEKGWIYVESLNDYLLVKGSPNFVKKLLKKLYDDGILQKYSLIEVVTTNGKRRTLRNDEKVRKYMEDMEEDAAGLVVKGVNTTLDVDVDSIRKEARKLGHIVNRKGVPFYNYRKSVIRLKKKNNVCENFSKNEKLEKIFEKNYLNLDVKYLSYEEAKNLFSKNNERIIRIGDNVLGIKNNDTISFWKKDDNNKYLIYEKYFGNFSDFDEHLKILNDINLYNIVKISDRYFPKRKLLGINKLYKITYDGRVPIMESYIDDYEVVFLKLKNSK